MNGINFNSSYSNYSNFNQQPKQDPDAYAKQYADANNLSLEEAKAELKTKFGDPKEGANIPFLNGQQASIFTSSTSEDSNFSIGNNFNYDLNNSIFDSQLNNTNASGNFLPQQKDPDEYAKEYAQENNISLEQAREELMAQFGEPQEMEYFA